MTSYKKISFAFALAMLFQLTNCAQNQNINPSALDILKEKYEYTKDVDEKIAPKNAPQLAPRVISDTITSHYSDTGFTRTRISTEITGRLRIRTTEKWITKHSSWATWVKWTTMMLGWSTVTLIAASNMDSTYDYGRNLTKSISELNTQITQARYDKQNDDLLAKLRAEKLSIENKLNNIRTAVFSGGAVLGLALISITLFPVYQYLFSQEQLNKEIVEKETIELERELMALQAKELEVLAQEPQL